MADFAVTEDGRLVFPDNVSVFFEAGDNLDKYRRDDSVLLMQKSRWYLDVYRQIKTIIAAPRNIMEVGVFRGGSVAFFHQYFEPAKLVAIELSRSPLPALDAYVRNTAVGSISIHQGVDQGDRAALHQIVEAEFAEPLDLVIDDASHYYKETKATFETVFPYLRPMGIYVIEDWGWSHSIAAQASDHFWWSRGSPSALMLELLAVFASNAKIIIEVAFPLAGLMWVRRGPAQLPCVDFHLEDHTRLRGRTAPEL